MFSAIPEFLTWEGNIFAGILVFFWSAYLWNQYLAFRQIRVYYQNVDPPQELQGIMDRTTYEKSRLYGLDQMKFIFARSMFNIFFFTGIMVFGVIPALWKKSGVILDNFRSTSVGSSDSLRREIIQTIVFQIFWALVTDLPDVPWNVYITFKLEQKHGFNKQTPRSFIKDQLIKLLANQLMYAIGATCIVHGIAVFGDSFFASLIVSITFSVPLMNIILQNCLPLYMKFRSLPEGDLKSQIEMLAQEMKFPLKKIYIVEGSKRSAHSNAFFYGFCNNKKIVIYDTLIKDYNKPNTQEGNEDVDNITDTALGGALTETTQVEAVTKFAQEGADAELNKEPKKTTGCNTEEILAILCHEFGHWKLNHIIKNMIILQIYLAIGFLAVWWLYNYAPLFRAFGFNDSQPVFIGYIIILLFVISPFSLVYTFFSNLYSRRCEYQADKFACKVKHGEQLKRSLITTDNNNLNFPLFDPLFSIWNNSHPTLLERIRAINKYERDMVWV